MIGLIRYKVFSFLLFLVMAACGTSPEFVSQSPQSSATMMFTTPNNTPLPTSTLPINNGGNCKRLRDYSGLPEISEVKETHIIYLADNLDKTSKEVTSQLWTISMGDGSEKLLLENVPELGLGFLPDGFHFLLVGPEVLESDLSGTPPRKVSSRDYENLFPRYSLLWNQISNDPEAYESQSGVNGLYLYSTDGNHLAKWKYNVDKSNPDPSYPLTIQSKKTGHEVEVFRTSAGEMILGNWSPDGQHFVFTWYKNSENYYSVVYMVNADGSELRPLSEHIDHSIPGRPLWSPNGKKIGVPVLIGSSMKLLVVDLSKNEVKGFSISPVIKDNDLVDQGEMVWSPDSQWFAYISQIEHLGIELLNTNNGEIYCGDDHDIRMGIYKLDWR